MPVDVGRVEAGKFIKAVRQPIQQIQIILLFFYFLLLFIFATLQYKFTMKHDKQS